MTGFDPIGSAVAAAGHVIFVYLMIRLVDLAIVCRAYGTRIELRDAMVWGGYALASALILERIYYVLARAAAPFGANLWAAHPAPELLVALINCALGGTLYTWRRGVYGPAQGRSSSYVDLGVCAGLTCTVLILLT
ncbi:MAG: hypothetical protein ACU0CO_01270 [Shimia sp.]